MRRNVLSWLAGEVPNARHALVLTHNIHFLFVQSALARKLRQAGNPRITIFADAMCAAQSFAEQRALLDGLGVRYRVVPVDLGVARRFHPKAFLLAGPDRAALAIGSGNLTHGGMAANHEAWAFAVSDGEGAALIAAFREYLDGLLPNLPLAQSLRDELDLIFDPAQDWVANLPPAAGLASSPSDLPLLDQIARLVTGKIHSVSIMAPYHDESAVALTTIAERFAVPVTCWIQPGHEGLSKATAAILPPNVNLTSINCEESRRPSFIHAKIMAFHQDNDVVLAVGSANCSQAALLAGRSWGNAELMAVGAISHAAADAFFSDLVRGDDVPQLPDQPPSDDWEMITLHPLRVLAARHEGDQLHVAYHFTGELTDLFVKADAGTWPAATVDAERGIATFSLSQRLRTIMLRGRGPGGDFLESPETWVDDEASLAAPATFRRVLRRIQEGEADGSDAAQAFRSVLELFRDYLRDPAAARRHLKRPKESGLPPGLYDPQAVFSDDFGRLGVSASGEGIAAHTPTSVLSIIEALFRISREVGGVTSPPPSGSGEADGEDADPEAAQRTLIRKVKVESQEKAAAQLKRALLAMEQALSEPGFVDARSPTLLGADLALAAILLVKGLADGLLDVATFRESTRRLWGILFFGEKGKNIEGTLFQRVGRISESAERDSFIAELVTPRLAAALALWSMTEWNAGDVDSLWFRCSAARLNSCHPWLVAAAAPDVVVAEIKTIAAGLLPPNEQAAATRTWIELVRAGLALRTLEDALAERSHEELRAAIKSPNVGPSDIVWVNGRLALPIGTFSREDGVNAHVRFLSQSSTSRYRASFLLPVRELIEVDALGLPCGAKEEALKIINSISRLAPPTLS